MYTWLPIHGVSSTCEVTISDILCVYCKSGFWHSAHLQYPEKTTHSFIFISQYSSSWESERGNLHYDRVAISRICWHNLISWQSPCIMYEHLARANSSGGGGGFCNKYVFVSRKRKLTTALGFILRLKLFTISDKMNFGAVDDWAEENIKYSEI